MFCNKCGNEITNDSVFCASCGAQIVAAQPVQQYAQTMVAEKKANVGLVILSIIIPIVGIVLGIVNLCKKNKRAGKVYLIAGIVSGLVMCGIVSSIITPTMLNYIESAR